MVRIYLNDYLVIQDTHSFCDEVVMRSKSSIAASGVHTVSNRHFLSKNSTLISREKILWKCCGFELISCSQLWFHEKKFWVKNSWKCWCFVKIEFLDKNLTFRIVCSGGKWSIQRLESIVIEEIVEKLEILFDLYCPVSYRSKKIFFWHFKSFRSDDNIESIIAVLGPPGGFQFCGRDTVPLLRSPFSSSHSTPTKRGPTLGHGGNTWVMT